MANVKTNDTKANISTIDDAPGESNAIPAAKEQPVETVVVKGNGHDGELSGKRIKLTIHEQDTDLGKLDVTLGLNGIAYKIKRGVPVEVPVEIVGVLETAVEEIYESNGGAVMKRNRPRFSFQVHA